MGTGLVSSTGAKARESRRNCQNRPKMPKNPNLENAKAAIKASGTRYVESVNDAMTREEILAAIRRAAAELGRAPSRGELRRITGVSHYRVLSEFPTLREAVRAAGLEPNPKGEKISTEDLLTDWMRVAEKLGRRPSRAEYVREGRYSAGALTVRFGSWGKISTTEDTENHRGAKAPGRPNHKGHEGTQRKNSGAGKRTDEHGEPVLHNFDRVPLAAVPSPVVGMRRVTEEVAQMVVNTLLAPGNWQLAIGQKQNPFTTEVTEEHGGERSGDLVIGGSGDLYPTARTPRALGTQGLKMRAENGNPGSAQPVDKPRGLYKDRPVMGEPFDRRPMTNAPVNELGVMVLFGMVAAGLGLQVESVQGKFPGLYRQAAGCSGKVAVSAD